MTEKQSKDIEKRAGRLMRDTSAEVQKLEVACAELKGLQPPRTVYIKKGALFFRTDIRSATNLQRNMLEQAKASYEKV